MEHEYRSRKSLSELDQSMQEVPYSEGKDGSDFRWTHLGHVELLAKKEAFE
jgi:hypothetical protein